VSNNDEKAFYPELNKGTKYLVDDSLSSCLEAPFSYKQDIGFNSRFKNFSYVI